MLHQLLITFEEEKDIDYALESLQIAKEDGLLGRFNIQRPDPQSRCGGFIMDIANDDSNSYVYEFNTSDGLVSIRSFNRGQAASYLRSEGYTLLSDPSPS